MSFGYLEILKKEFSERCRNNAMYSLRSFARDISCSPSSVSEILNKRGGLSAERAQFIAGKLGLGPEEKEIFILDAESKHSRSKKQREAATENLKILIHKLQKNYLNEDNFKLVSEWYHFALIELMQLSFFRSDKKWMASTLKISLIELEEALERMLRMEIIAKDGDNFVLLKKNNFVPGGTPSKNIKNFHSGVLDQAKKAIRQKPFEKRFVNSSMIAVNSADIPEAFKRLEKVKREICRDLGVKNYKDDVYGVSIQMFSCLND